MSATHPNPTTDLAPWWLQEPPPPTSRADVEYDASLDVDPPDPDPWTDSDLDYFAELAADRYERHLTRDW